MFVTVTTLLTHVAVIGPGPHAPGHPTGMVAPSLMAGMVTDPHDPTVMGEVATQPVPGGMHWASTNGIKTNR